jgi:outer membrane autotransporter protein
VSADDGRYGRDFYGRLADVYAGLDYRISGDALIGIAMGGEFWDASDFGGTLRSSVDTFVIGPYGAWRLTDWLMVDSWFGYARGSQSITLAFLEGDRTIDTVFVSLNMTAQAWVDGFRIRPKVSAYAANANAGGFSFVAPPSVIGTSFAIPVSSSSDGIALAEASVEIAYPMRVNDSVVVTPTLRPGATVATNRANGGRVVTGELDVTTPAQVYGSIRVGLQVNVGNRTAVDLSAGYMSIGQPGLDLWSGRIAVNVAF